MQMVECSVRRELADRLGEAVSRLSSVPTDAENADLRAAAGRVAHLAKEELDRHVKVHGCRDPASVECEMPERLD